MTKDEILKKSKNENCIADEMKIYVNRTESENAYLFLKSILIILFIISSIKVEYYGNFFVSPYLFSFLLFAGITSQLLTRYHYYKKTKDLILILFFIFVVILSAWLCFIY